MENPRSTSVGSNMPAYPWLFRQTTDIASLENKIAVQRSMGVPFPPRTAEEIHKDAIAQGQVIVDDLKKSGIKISPDREIIAMIAYLQQLGKYAPKPPANPPKDNPGVETLVEKQPAQANGN
jgi:cytochrome c oxidase cbb3-type subunit I/II